MVWTRSDDREVYDRKIGELTDREYRERDALIAYIAREHPDTGFFHENEHKHAGYASPNGTKSVRKTTMQRFQTLGLVRTAESYSDEELESLGLTRPGGPGGEKWLRCTNWERYNPPRDRTNAERQARYRNALRNTEVTDEKPLRNSPSRAGAARVPVPSLSTSNSQPGLDAPRERADDDEEQARHHAWHARAQAPDIRSPQAFIAAGMRTGGWPDPAPTEQRVTVNGSAPADAGCPSCGVGGGVHAADCDQAVDAGASSEVDSFGLPFGRYQPLGDKVVDAEGNELRIESVRPALEHVDNRTEEQ